MYIRVGRVRFGWQSRKWLFLTVCGVCDMGLRYHGVNNRWFRFWSAIK